MKLKQNSVQKFSSSLSTTVLLRKHTLVVCLKSGCLCQGPGKIKASSLLKSSQLTLSMAQQDVCTLFKLQAGFQNPILLCKDLLHVLGSQAQFFSASHQPTSATGVILGKVDQSSPKALSLKFCFPLLDRTLWLVVLTCNNLQHILQYFR